MKHARLYLIPLIALSLNTCMQANLSLQDGTTLEGWLIAHLLTITQPQPGGGGGGDKDIVIPAQAGLYIIDSTGNVGEESRMVLDGATIFLSYFDASNSRVRFAHSDDYGNNWTLNPQNHVEDRNTGSSLSLAYNGSKLFLGYNDTSVSGQFRRAISSDRGETWSPGLSSLGGTYNSMVTSGNEVFVATYVSAAATNFLQFYSSNDEAETWSVAASNPQLTGTDSFQGQYAKIGYNGSRIIASYTDVPNKKLYTAYSTDKTGASWTRAAFTSSSDIFAEHSLAVNGQNVFISYYEPVQQILKVAVSNNSGTSYITRTIDDVGTVGRHSSIVAQGNNIYVSYKDVDNNNLKLARSRDGGVTWNYRTVHDTIDDVGNFSNLLVNNNAVYITYHDSTNSNLRLAVSSDGGETFN